MTDLQRLDACIATIRAIRVARWCMEWPSAHPESPHRPRFVREFEAQHGPAPESAERVMGQQPKGEAEGGGGKREP